MEEIDLLYNFKISLSRVWDLQNQQFFHATVKMWRVYVKRKEASKTTIESMLVVPPDH